MRLLLFTDLTSLGDVNMNDNNLPIHDHTDQGIKLMEEERRQLAHDLSEGPARALTDISLHLDTILQLFHTNPDLAKHELRRMNSRLVATVNDIHGLVHDLLPMAIDDIGLPRALTVLCHRLARAWKISIDVSEPIKDKIRISPAKQVALYRLIRHALYTLHHNNPTAYINMQLSHHEHAFCISLDVDTIDSSVLFLNEQVDYLGGKFQSSIVQDGRTRIDVTMPHDVTESLS